MASIREAAGGSYEVKDHKGDFYCRTNTFEEALRAKREAELGEPEEVHAHTKRCRAHQEFMNRPLQFEWLRRRWG
jgi:hypothetical protein